MNRSEFAGIAEFVEALWPTSKPFGDETLEAAYHLFEKFDPETLRTAASRLFRKGLEFAPTLSQLAAEGTSVAREQARLEDESTKALPAGSRRMTFREWSMKEYGEVLDFSTLIRRRHAELEGKPVSLVGISFPGEVGFIEDGAYVRVECRSPLCDIHRDDPIDAPAEVAFS